MAASSTPPRPRQVTALAIVIMVSSIACVLTQVSYLPSLTSLDMRERMTDVLAEPPGSSLGLSVDGVLDLLRVLSFVTAGCATATAILGFSVLQRSVSARWGLSVLALPLFLAGTPSAGLLAAVVAAGSMMLWLQPARAWYRGEEIPERFRRPRSRPAERSTPPVPTPPPTTSAPPTYPAPPSAVSAPPVSQPGSPSAPSSAGAPPPYPGPYGAAPGQAPNPYAQPSWRPEPLAERPPVVLVACLLTWAVGAVVAGAMGLMAIALVAAPSDLIDEAFAQTPELADLPYSRDQLVTSALVMSVVVALWALLAIALAVGVFVGSRASRIALTVSASTAGVLLLVSVITAPLLLLPAAAAIATVVLLARADARRWCTRHR